MSVNEGWGVNPLSTTKEVFFFKRKRCRMFRNVKIGIWKSLKLFWILSLIIIRFRPFGIYSCAYRIIIKKKLFGVRKKAVLAVGGGVRELRTYHVKKHDSDHKIHVFSTWKPQKQICWVRTLMIIIISFQENSKTNLREKKSNLRLRVSFN